MEIKREDLTKRKEEAIQAITAKNAEVLLLKGIVEDCDHWLKILESEKKDSSTNKKVN